MRLREFFRLLQQQGAIPSEFATHFERAVSVIERSSCPQSQQTTVKVVANEPLSRKNVGFIQPSLQPLRPFDFACGFEPNLDGGPLDSFGFSGDELSGGSNSDLSMFGIVPSEAARCSRQGSTCSDSSELFGLSGWSDDTIGQY